MIETQPQLPELHFFEESLNEHRDRVIKPVNQDDAQELELQEQVENFDFINQLRRVPENREGLHIDRVEKFMAAKGLSMPPSLITDMNKLSRMPVLRGYPMYEYSPRYDMAFVARNMLWEAANGVELTEAMLVHESAHGSYRDRQHTILISNGEREDEWTRIGMRVSGRDWKVRGAFLEEGFAELLAGQYRVAVTGRSNGLIKEDEYPNLRFQTHGVDFKIPARYAIYDPSDELTGKGFVASGIAAAGLEILIEKRPELYQQLLDARSGKAEDIRAVIATINSVHPGLYGMLRELQYKVSDFAAGLAEIRRLTDEPQ